MSENPIQSAFSSWKIVVAILLGLSISVFMIYKSLSQEQFIEVSQQEATHTWVDGNKNGKIDLNDATDFQVSKEGNYRIKRMQDLILDMNWTSASLLWIGLAVLFMVLRDVFYMIRIRVLTKNALTWRGSFRTIMLWEFASALSPGVVGGAAVAMFILNREKIPLGRSTAIVVITAMMDNLFYVLLIPIIFMVIPATTLFPIGNTIETSIAYTFWIGFSIIALLCLILFLSIFMFPTLIGSLIRFVFRLPFLRRWKEKAMQTAEEVQVTSKELKKEPFRFWLFSFGATLGSWISRYLVINCILAAFISLSFYDHFMILGKQLVLWLFMLISPTPGASGIAEYAFGELLASFSSSALLLSALALLWRLISYFPYLFIGSFILPKWLKSKNKDS